MLSAKKGKKKKKGRIYILNVDNSTKPLKITSHQSQHVGRLIPTCEHCQSPLTLNNLFFSIFQGILQTVKTYMSKIPLKMTCCFQSPFTHSLIHSLIIHFCVCLVKFQTILSAVCLALRFYETSFCLQEMEVMSRAG